VLLAIWADVGHQMRRLLEASTLADVVAIAQGRASWPEPTR
jgi:DNA-binding IscR family transcriptional regulator